MKTPAQRWTSGLHWTPEDRKDSRMKTFIIDGSNFSNMEEFYDEADRVFTTGFRSGHNLDAFEDLLKGGFGRHDDEPIRIKWIHYKRSRFVMNHENLLDILETILDCDNTGHDCKLEIYP